MNKITEAIIKSDNFIIASHYSPDGDNLGSCFAMYHALKLLNKEVMVVVDDVIPKNLSFLCSDVIINKSNDVKDIKYSLIALDCGDKNRICLDKKIIENCHCLINIDHHASNTGYGDINLVEEEISSTCEIVYNLLNYIDKSLINKVIGRCLYTGLVTDTGNFMYSNVKPESFLMAYNLLKLDIDKSEIITNIYQNNPLNYTKLLGDALTTLEIIEGKIAVICVDSEMFKRNNISFNDVEGIVNYTRDIEGVEVGILLKEKNYKEIKVSLRSKSNINVNEIASSLSGGGHIRAAGCTIRESLDCAREIIVSETLKHMKRK